MAKVKCQTKFCRNKVDSGNFCSTCRSRRSREANKLNYTYNNLKNNAKRRGKEFTLTLEQFSEFCYETNYLVGKGKTKESLSIDRLQNHIGYTIDNIRPLSVSENSRKGVKILSYDFYTKHATVINTRQDQANSGDQPF